jgi:hypothetical protein
VQKATTEAPPHGTVVFWVCHVEAMALPHSGPQVHKYSEEALTPRALGALLMRASKIV